MKKKKTEIKERNNKVFLFFWRKVVGVSKKMTVKKKNRSKSVREEVVITHEIFILFFLPLSNAASS